MAVRSRGHSPSVGSKDSRDITPFLTGSCVVKRQALYSSHGLICFLSFLDSLTVSQAHREERAQDTHGFFQSWQPASMSNRQAQSVLLSQCASLG
jgi:hypothetical protein